MKNYRLIYEDKAKNEIEREVIAMNNIKEARSLANEKLFTSNMNDLHRIVVKLNN